MHDADRLPLEARGVIGDTATAALSAADGTIDWYCPGRVDAPAALYRILDPRAGAAVRVGPAGLGPAARRRAAWGSQAYDPGTNVLRTRLTGPDGELEVADVMPWSGGTDRPDGRIVRLVTALRGPVAVEVEVVPGEAFAPTDPVSTWSGGLAFGELAVRCPAGFAADPGAREAPTWRATRRLEPGEQFVVTIDRLDDDHHRPLSADAAGRVLEATAGAWRRHVFPLTYNGPYRAAVERSALAVKLLQSSASGSVAAAATTSLPEVPGGERNFDRRLVRLADVAVAVRAFEGLGQIEDRLAAEGWLRAVVDDNGAPLPAFFDIEGGAAPPEEELRLPGRLGSQPVRTGAWFSALEGPGGAPHDALGDLVAAVESTARFGGPLAAVRPGLVGTADWLADHWAEPEQGVWELRRPRPLVASRVQAWFALDRLARMALARNPLDLDSVGWRQAAGDLLRWLEREGTAADGGLRMDDDPADLPDAALLRIAWQGPWPARPGGSAAPVVARTVDRVLLQLSSGVLVHPYPPEVDDGQAGAPAADLAASFWAVRALACLDRWDAAHDRMEALCRLGRPLGLLAEGIHPVSGRLLGNLPSARAHLGLIAAALALEAGPR